jgi:cell division septation protein DedD
VRDLDRIQEVSEYRVTGPQLGSLVVLVLVLVSFSGLAGYQAGVMHGPVDEQLLSPSTGASAGGSAVLADMLAERERSAQSAGGEGIEGVPPRMGAPGLSTSLTDPDPDVSDAAAEEETDTRRLDLTVVATPLETEATPALAEVITPEPVTPEPERVTEAAEVPEPPVAEADEGAARSTSDAPKGKGFTIQLAAYPSPKEADELVASLRAAGFDEAFYQFAKVNGRTWYRVRVGIYRSRPEAESAAGRLAGVSPYDPYITTHP